MEKVNFQQETERAIARLCGEGRPPLLLHACCAPCSSYVLEYLTRYFTITLFFSNPNITDPAEYQKRLAELRRLCAEAPFCGDVTVVEDDISPEEFLRAHAEVCLRIPMRPTLRSLNLSNSVAITVYEALRQLEFPGMQSYGSMLNQ